MSLQDCSIDPGPCVRGELIALFLKFLLTGSDQISDFPNNRKWRLNIGGGWDIERQGDCLRVSRSRTKEEDAQRALQRTESQLELLEKQVLSSDDFSSGLGFDGDSLHFVFPIGSYRVEDVSFFRTSVAACRTLDVTPPWRNSPVRVKELLRGQRVPLHARDSASVILLRTADHEEKVVAVHVDTREEKWVVSSEFNAAKIAKSSLECFQVIVVRL